MSLALPLLLGSLVVAFPVAALAQTCLPKVTRAATEPIAWNAPPVDTSATLTGYTVEQRMDGGSWGVIASLPATALTYLWTGFASPHTYDAQVRAVWMLPDGTVETSEPGDQGTPPPCVRVPATVGKPSNVRLLNK